MQLLGALLAYHSPQESGRQIASPTSHVNADPGFEYDKVIPHDGLRLVHGHMGERFLMLQEVAWTYY
jgi:hypothetical protein